MYGVCWGMYGVCMVVVEKSWGHKSGGGERMGEGGGGGKWQIFSTLKFKLFLITKSLVETLLNHSTDTSVTSSSSLSFHWHWHHPLAFFRGVGDILNLDQWHRLFCPLPVSLPIADPKCFAPRHPSPRLGRDVLGPLCETLGEA